MAVVIYSCSVPQQIAVVFYTCCCCCCSIPQQISIVFYSCSFPQQIAILLYSCCRVPQQIAIFIVVVVVAAVDVAFPSR